MKKILILANNDIGLYKFRKELIQELIREGNKVYISLPNGELVNPLVDMGCIFINTPINRRGSNIFEEFKLLIKYFNIILKIRPDLVVTYTIKPNIYGGILCNLLKVPYILNITGLGTAFQKKDIFNKIITTLYKLACSKVKIVFFENIQNQSIFVDNNIITKDLACSLNGAGVNLDEYIFSEYPKSDFNIRFLFIGRVMKEKGIDELFSVAKRIKKEYSNIFFHIVGPLEEDYEEIISDLAKQKVIEYHGYQTDVKSFIKSSHCFVLPSYHEGMANTLLESASIGRPLITSDIHGCKEAVNGKNGYLCKSEDSNDLYEKIVKFIELPYEKKVSMAKESRKHMENNFDKNNVIKKTMRYFSL